MKEYPILKELTNLELVILQHQARRFPEDKEFVEDVLRELGARVKGGKLEIWGRGCKGQTEKDGV